MQGSRGDGVRSLQNNLNVNLTTERPPLNPDGVFGMKTKDRVVKFQRLNGLVADGIAGPKTITKLQSKLGPGTPGTPGVITPPPHPQPPSVGGAKFRSEMHEVFIKEKAESEWPAYLAAFEQGSIPAMKQFLTLIGRAEDARAVATFFINLRRWGLTAQEIGLIFDKIKTFNTAQAVKFFDATTAPTSKFGSALGAVSTGAARVGLVLTAIECAIHASRGDYSVIPAEIYKYAMGKGVPWAAVIDGIGSLLDGFVPENTRNNSTMFRILRSLDPIGLGAVAVDSVASIVLTCYDMAVAGKVNVDVVLPRLSRLVDRMKSSPAAIFVKIGEDCGDALYELSVMGEIDFRAMYNYTWMEVKEFFGIK
ncbi:MAG: peptidoglycan-binding protein [Blastocatellia bacterium]|nr:peptidoglycan-binding protein [Blastocatellia bacterium]